MEKNIAVIREAGGFPHVPGRRAAAAGDVERPHPDELRPIFRRIIGE